MSKFEIKAKTCTLGLKQEGPDIILDGTTYIIPVYQRPYSWSAEQLRRFISDIFISYHGHDNESDPEPMFIGTMQLSGKKEKKQEVIDGQQRLTTFLILIKVLKEIYLENKKIQEIPLDWIETCVNGGEQNGYLTKFIECSKVEDLGSEQNQNPYVKNSFIIKGFLESEPREVGDVDKFIEHLRSKVYFVVIETTAGLSKTLQIFDAINTTGLDLNTGDIFKIRMYEYLAQLEDDESNKDENNSETFKKIDALYAKIDKENKKRSLSVSMLDILKIYQYFLIAKYELPKVLYKLGTSRFFERLFDTLFEIQVWDDFNSDKALSKESGFKLSLENIEKFIEIRYKWQDLFFPPDKSPYSNATAEELCSLYFVWWSRYGKYSLITYLFMYSLPDDEKRNTDIFQLTIELSKLFIVYSVLYGRSVNDIDNFVYQLLKNIMNSEKGFNLIEAIRGKKEGKKGSFKKVLEMDITDKTKKKNLLCRLSAMIEEENYQKNTNIEKSKKIREKLFNPAREKDFEIDIEHIQSYNDEDKTKREQIKTEWGEELLNSIGNLVVLERKINRSISNSKYDIKISKEPSYADKNYQSSTFQIVQKQAGDFNLKWGKEECEKRKKDEIKKLLEYLFGENTKTNS